MIVSKHASTVFPPVRSRSSGWMNMWVGPHAVHYPYQQPRNVRNEMNWKWNGTDGWLVILGMAV